MDFLRHSFGNLDLGLSYLVLLFFFFNYLLLSINFLLEEKNEFWDSLELWLWILQKLNIQTVVQEMKTLPTAPQWVHGSWKSEINKGSFHMIMQLQNVKCRLSSTHQFLLWISMVKLGGDLCCLLTSSFIINSNPN